MKANKVKLALARGEPSVGTWLSLGSVAAARFMARVGFDWLTVDLEHTPTDWETAAIMCGAIADAGCVPLVRVPAGRHDYIKRVLDFGGMGIIAPMVKTVAEAAEIAAACKYPPRGQRSVGGSLHALNFDTSVQRYFAEADNELLVVAQIEHPDGVEAAEAIAAVDGIDALLVGPNDLRANMRGEDGSEPDDEEFEAALQRVLAACKKAGKPAGIHVATIEAATRRLSEGWQLIAVASELRFMLDGAQHAADRLCRGGAGDLARY
jgi:4-hydroxy-2-oxoheptanedioate aldolase